MLRINNSTISLTRGDTARIELAISKDGAVYDFSQDTVVFSVKKSTSSPDYIIHKQVVDGVIYLKPEDTAHLQVGSYKYDVQLTTQSGDVCTVIPPSVFNVEPEVTWTAS